MKKAVTIAWVLLALCALLATTDARSGRGRGGGRRRALADRSWRSSRPRNYIHDIVLPWSQWKPWWSHRWARDRAGWWTGPNVCETKEGDPQALPDGEGFMLKIKECGSGEDGSYRCTYRADDFQQKYTATVTYRCCAGYARQQGKPGCPLKVAELKNLLDTARGLGLSEFVSYAGKAKLEGALTGMNNFTVFAPTDGAFQSIPTRVITDFDSPSKRATQRGDTPALTLDQLKDTLLSHVVSGWLTANNIRDEEILRTLGPGEIRTTAYSNKKIVNANCVKVVLSDQLASNGVIHVVDGILPNTKKSVLEIISQDSRFTTLKTALGQTDLPSVLDSDGQMTVFAPTDSAFDNVPQETLNRLLADRRCLKNLLLHHVIPHTICADAVTGKHRAVSMVGEDLKVERDSDDKIFVNTAQVIQGNVLGYNGVVHVIDNVLVPSKAQNIVDVLAASGASRLVELIEIAGLTDTLRSQDNITIFAPSDQAIEELPEETVKALTSNPGALAEVLQYHVVPQAAFAKDLKNGAMLPTLGSSNKLHISVKDWFFHTMVNVQCARVVKADQGGCNGVVHVINKVLAPPTQTLADVLEGNETFSILVKALRRADLITALQADGPLTIFAPTNEAFKRIADDTLDNLLENTEALIKVLKHHVVEDFLCCDSCFSRRGKFRQVFRRSPFSYSSHDGASVTSCDTFGTNGVIQVIDRVLRPPGIHFDN
ncbi:transforming growth factor-beta-induced protein ig-h3-like isoform X1 [Branchiostoma floridae]|uniref:Transforming growth factor-beta-induced protein ig-h3-like isoform X1 n=2 Tax=Branchiostoma floridae TaxID=7739 RepID=A0A9J7LWY5_BRAFL|nr:transforming growth factor-beta-induced protein ig-h3-like isoform X1 [Branchiostoma floridae]